MPKLTKILTLEECETGIASAREEASQFFAEKSRTFFFTIRDNRLYKPKYDTFEMYCEIKWKLTRRRVDQIITAEKVQERIEKLQVIENEQNFEKHASQNASNSRISYRAAEAIEDVPDDKILDVYTSASKNGKVTPASIQAAQPKVQMSAYTSAPKDEGIEQAEEMEAESKVIRDDTGHPVPENLLELWNRADEVQKLLSSISKVRGALETAQKSQDILFVEVNFSSSLAELGNAYTNIKKAMPYAVCSTCQGKKPANCAFCKGRGFLSAFRWHSVPSEIKALREKVRK